MNLRCLWKSQNLRVWQNISETCQAITVRARQLLHDWREANIRKLYSDAAGNMAEPRAANRLQHADVQSLMPSQVKWAKPQQGRLKCNIDGAFSVSLNRVGVELCKRDAAGNFIRQRCCGLIPYVHRRLGKRWDCSMQFIGCMNYNF